MKDNRQNDDAEDDLPWESLFERAEKVVNSVIQSLPAELRERADNIPCLFEKWPDSQLADGTLGTYTGFEHGHVSDQNGPIVLFLGAIYNYCAEEDDFEEEVRMTYLHEFGHHLGMDESDLEDRGLL